MIKSIRNKIVSVLALIACVMFAMLIGVNANLTVKADTQVVDTNVFAMKQTASVRTDKDPAGIRFMVELGKDKYAELAKIDETSSKESLDFIISVDKTGNKDANEARVNTYTVSADNFKNSDVINLMYTITFDKVSNTQLIEAYAMNLTAECYVVDGTGATAYAKGSGVAQDMRSVASFNVLNGEDNPALEDYYENLDVVSNSTEIASYVAGTAGVKIAVSGLTGTDYDVYVDTYLIENATIANGVVTILEDDMPALSGAEKHYIQLFDASGNVIAKELTEEIDVYADTVTLSAMDGDIDYSAIFGSEAVTGAEIVSTTAEQTSEVTFADGKLNGIDTIRATWTDVQVKLSTEYSVKKVNLKVATKIIDEAEDLDVFSMKLIDSSDKSKGTVENGGYYVLANDIDASEYTQTTHAFAGGSYPLETELGLTGTFDGQGHTISNYVAPNAGMFGQVSGGTIKNVAFVNANVHKGDDGYYMCLLAHRFNTVDRTSSGRYASIENVYITVSATVTRTKTEKVSVLSSNNMIRCNITNTYIEVTSVPTDGRMYAMVANTSDIYTAGITGTWTNYFVVANMAYVSRDKTKDITVEQANDIVGHTASADITAGETSIKAGDVINEEQAQAIIDAGITSVTVKDQHIGVANNVTDVTSLGGLYSYKSYTQKNIVTNLKMYATTADMSKDATANADSLATFSKDYWMIFNGMPLWKGIDNFVAVADSEVVNVDTPANISLVDVDGNKVENITVTVDGDGKDYVVVDGSQIRVSSAYTISSNYALTVTVKATVDGVEIEKTLNLSVVPATGKTIENVYVEADGTLVGLSEEDATLLANATYSMDASALTFADGKFDMAAFSIKTLGEYYEVSALVGGKAHTLKVRYVTKTIDEASDLSLFVLKAKESLDGTRLGVQEVDGYYVLTKHIDASTYTPAAHKGFVENDTYPTGGKDLGFIGTLDGQGYTISNLTTVSNGLFGEINGATIKNIAFINGKTSTTGRYATFIAHHLWNATLENVYIEISEMNVGGDDTSSILSANSTNLVTMNNVVVNVTAKAEDQIDGKYYRLAGSIYNDELSEGYTGKWANVYTIADLAFSVRSKNYNMTISSAADLVGHTLNANYPVGETTYSTGTVVTEEIAQAIYGAGTTKVAVKDDRVFTASNVSAETAETYRAYGFKYWSQKKLATGIKSYVDTTAMTEDATANATSLATFSSTYWTVTNGIPTWANIPAAE